MIGDNPYIIKYKLNSQLWKQVFLKMKNNNFTLSSKSLDKYINSIKSSGKSRRRRKNRQPLTSYV